jgi:hypothetical protein
MDIDWSYCGARWAKCCDRSYVVWVQEQVPVRFLFVGLDEERSLKMKCGFTRRSAVSHFGYCCLHTKKGKDQLKQHAIFAHDLAKWKEVDGGFFEHLLWSETNWSFKQWIKIELTGCNFSFCITIHIAFVSVDSNSSVLCEYQINLKFANPCIIIHFK